MPVLVPSLTEKEKRQQILELEQCLAAIDKADQEWEASVRNQLEAARNGSPTLLASLREHFRGEYEKRKQVRAEVETRLVKARSLPARSDEVAPDAAKPAIAPPDKTLPERPPDIVFNLKIGSILTMTELTPKNQRKVQGKVVALSGREAWLIPERAKYSGTLPPVGAWISVEVEIDDRRYEFKTRIMEAKVGIPPQYCIRTPEHVCESQRRTFYRVSCALTATITSITRPNWDGAASFPGGREGFLVQIEDISGSGLGIVSPTPLPLNAILKMHFELPLNNPARFEISAMVMHIRPFRKPGGTGFRAGVQFLSLTNVEQDLIVRYVTQRQIELLRAELG